MPIVDRNRVKGNYGVNSLTKELSKFCLVRPVSDGTDQGIDLYCETFERPNVGGRPFLHFWAQVKTTTKSTLQDGNVSQKFKCDHLQYWSRQPVPVFAFIICYPDIYPFYIIDIKYRILEHPELLRGNTRNLRSTLTINSEIELKKFILEQIPYLSVSSKVSEGVIPTMPTLDKEYEIRAVTGSCYRYLDRFLWQIRKTSAFAIIGSFEMALENQDLLADIRKLSSISGIFRDDMHWETPCSLGFAAFLDRDYEESKGHLERAISLIDADPKIKKIESWKRTKEYLREIIAKCDMCQWQSQIPQ